MNIAQIAKLAGVSNAAVSRYFNNGYISDEKREAIRRVVEDTGYRPSVQAQTLRTKKTMMIGVAASRISDEPAARMIDGVLEALQGSAYRMMLFAAQDDPCGETAYPQAFNDRQVDGIILLGSPGMPGQLRRLREMRVPAVIVGQKAEGFCSIYHDEYMAMRDMTESHIRAGCRHFAYIGLPMPLQAAGDSYRRGFCDALRMHGIRMTKPGMDETASDMPEAAAKAEKLLTNKKKLDCIVCENDELAAGVLLQLHRRGIKVPEEIRVSGLGDTKLARAFAGEMSTIRYEYEESGRIAAGLLMEMLGGASVSADHKAGYTIVE